MRIKFATPVLLLASLLAAIVTPLSSQAQDSPRRIEIVAKRFTFTPNDITIKKGVPVVLVLTSQDTSHGLQFKGLNVNIKAKKGETAQVNFTPAATGDFVGQCSVFCGSGHGSMKMTIHVTE
jgi:cytochrome c oxidase subunit 2